MLALHPADGALKRADNLFPRANGAVYTRPGAVQVMTGRVDSAQPWGNFIVAHVDGRLVVWNGVMAFDIEAATVQTLHGVAYRALTGGGMRESRFYLADRVHPLSYLRWTGTDFERVPVVNSVLDANGIPYPIPIPHALANWSNRLWIADGSNRIQFCQNEDPDQWDPLWAQEFCDDVGSRVVTLGRLGDSLAVGLYGSIFQLVGTSQYDFQPQQLTAVGVIGLNGMVSDGNTLLWVSPHGLHVYGIASPISDDLRDMFLSANCGAQLAIDQKRRLLLMYAGARLFVMHLDNPGQFTEVVAPGVAGIIAIHDFVGWYGEDGVWLFTALNTSEDQRADGSHQSFDSIFETWDVHPNLNAGGRSLLNRTRLLIAGYPGGSANYRASVDDLASFAESVSLSNDVPAPWGDVPYSMSQALPFRPVQRELCPRLAGEAFTHRVASAQYFELWKLAPEYRFGAA